MLAEELERIHKELSVCVAPLTFMLVQRKLSTSKLQLMIEQLENCIVDLKQILKGTKA